MDNLKLKNQTTKNIWIWNHYATNTFFDRGGRHYWFAKYLLEAGYKPTIFCASTVHNSDNKIEVETTYKLDEVDGIPYVFVKTPPYQGNGLSRLKNMYTFYRKLFAVSRSYAQKFSNPDLILASSVHPLTLVAGIKVAKKFKIPCICEVRDLWPESLVAYDIIGKQSLIAKLLYKGEKWIYKKADKIVMTWPGGKQYIIDQGWDSSIDLAKIEHISNGVVISDFDNNAKLYSDLYKKSNDKYKDFIYTGSIRKVNNLSLLLDAAKLIQQRNQSIRFVIYGSGDELQSLEQRCKEEKIDNVIFKGRVPKHEVPSILSNSYANVLHNSSTILDKYGQSQNKLFEYLAAGRPILQTYKTGYSMLDEHNCGISISNQTAQNIADAVLFLSEDHAKANEMGANARSVSYSYDFTNLSKKLIKLINSALEEKNR